MISQRLVGRERELLELTTALAQAQKGTGGALIVAGPPGIGKTRLATELTATAHATGVGVHWGRCWQGDVAPAFWPWVQVLRSLAADDSEARAQLGEVLALIGPRSHGAAPPPADGFMVLDQLASAICASARFNPTVVVVDDLQWADASSLQAFAHIATTATSCALLLIACVRSTDEATRTDLGNLVRIAPRVEVAALSDQNTVELLTEALGEHPSERLLGRVLDACGGNPFYIRAVAEAARHGDTDVFPASVRGVVLGQLAGFDASARSLIAVASVLGREFTTRALASIADSEMPTVLGAIAEAERAGLVRAVSYGIRYTFVHDLVREAIYGGLPALERAELHQRAATFLAERDDELEIAARANHALAALPLGDAADAIALSTAAGDRARDRLAFEEAARWYRRAHDLAAVDASINPRARAELLLAEGSALRSVLSPRAEDVLDEAARAADALHDTELLTRIVVTWTYRHGGIYMFGPSLRHWVDRALAATPGPDRAMHARLIGVAAVMAVGSDWSVVWESLSRAKEMAAWTGDDRAELDVAVAEINLFWVLAFPDPTWPERAQSITERVEELARTTRDAGALADALSYRTELALRMTDVLAAERALTLLEREPFGPAVVAQIMGSIHRGAIAGLGADLAGMRAAAARAARLAGAIDTTALPMDWMDITHRYVFGRDDPVALNDAFGAAFPLPSDEALVDAGLALPWAPVFFSMAAMFAAEAGDLERAQRLLGGDPTSVLRWGGTQGSLGAVFLSEVAALCALPELAAAAYRRLEPAAGQLMYNAGIWTVFGSADYFLGRCASTLGRINDAQRHFTDALAIEQRIGAPHFVARTHLRLAELHAIRPDVVASNHLDACIALCDRHDLTYFRSCAEALAPARREQPNVATIGGTPNSMTHEGDMWAVCFDARTVRLKDAKGVHLLARLLSDPGREIHALDLAGASALVGADDGGPVLDAAAKEKYRQYLADLASDLEEARHNNDPERAARVEEQIDAVTDQLAGAVGLGGRDRRAASQSERARVAATRNLRAVIQRVGEVHPSLGRHLEMTIRTGTYCSYQPDPRVPVEWTID